jgi:hypothetical protein
MSFDGVATLSMVVPAQAGTHNPWIRGFKMNVATLSLANRVQGVWVPAFAGTTIFVWRDLCLTPSWNHGLAIVTFK